MYKNKKYDSSYEFRTIDLFAFPEEETFYFLSFKKNKRRKMDRRISYSPLLEHFYNLQSELIRFYDTEHWLYDDKIADIDSKLLIIVSNYSLSNCIRFYYNPTYKKYYEIGYDGYIGPTLETNDINEKNNSYKIIINKCSNNTFINNYMGYICNPNYEIKKYFNIYKEIFIFFRIIKFYL